ncbi:MAG: VanZ family protein [Lachnospiraceae bacterium]|nr:VanZ family protein [Lachnospiraceae bacterium]
MEIIYRDILKQWTNCWQEAIIVGIMFGICSRHINCGLKRQISVSALLFADGVFVSYLLYVTLLSRRPGSRQEVEFLPFRGEEILSGDYHYLIENVLLFVPFGFLLRRTLNIYGRKCSAKIIIWVSFLTSVSIELLQYVFSCGKTETDDVIANVLGAVLGGLAVRLKRVR